MRTRRTQTLGIYSIHLYEPAQFTMQGVTPNMPTGVTYPGIIGIVRRDRARMARSLQVVADYQRFYHVAVYIGELSAIRWAPGAEVWPRDAISIFEANGWDWSYHAFRKWQGWSEGMTGRLYLVGPGGNDLRTFDYLTTKDSGTHGHPTDTI